MTGGTANPAPSTPRRARRSQANSNNHLLSTVSPWDIPPVLASPSNPSTSQFWEARNCCWRTPQHLATVAVDVSLNDSRGGSPQLAWSTSITCPPLLWQNKYVVLTLVSGHILLFGDIVQHTLYSGAGDSTVESNSKPLSSLALPCDSAVVAILPISETEAPSESNGLLAVAANGCLYRISLKDNSNDSSTEEKSPPEASNVELQLEATFTTGQCRVTCAKTTSDGFLFVGYDSGHVDCWQFMWSKPKKRPKLLFHGLIEGLVSVEALGMLPKSETASNVVDSDQAGPTGGDGGDSDANPQRPLEPTVKYDLVATVQPRLGEDPPAIRVLDLDAILRAAKQQSRPLVRSTTEMNFPEIMLNAYATVADPAMYLVDPATTLPKESDAHLPKRGSVVVASNGTNDLMPLDQAKLGVALANGTVAVLESGWGVSSDNNQYFLPFPPVGMGRIELNQKEYLVCCLRAGTCYLLPTADNAIKEAIHVISYPHDIDEDLSSFYIQGFSTGNMTLHSLGGVSMSVPVLLFALAGGVVEVFSLELRTSSESLVPSEEEQVLEVLMEDGTVSQVCQLLEQMSERLDHPLLQAESWVAVKEEWDSRVDKQALSRWTELKDLPRLRQELLKLSFVGTP